jgi:hypothetical protein
MKNGARMKKYKKEDSKKNLKEKQDISFLKYSGKKYNEAILITSSWDGCIRIYDDSKSDSEHVAPKYTMDKHYPNQVNCIDFKENE